MPGPTDDRLRDHLANERTLLAWLRTAIALMGFGVVVARFGVFLDTMAIGQGRPPGDGESSRWVGAALLLTGTLVGLLGAWRTRAHARAIDSGHPPGARSLVATTALVASLGVGLTLWILLMD